MTQFHLTATLREQTGSKHARDARSSLHQTPAVVYGAGQKTLSLYMNSQDLSVALGIEALHSQVVQLEIQGKKVPVVLKAVQRHPSQQTVLHVDWLRVRSRQKIHLNVPIHFENEATSPGVQQGGVVQHLKKEVEVLCTPAKLPKYITCDLAGLALDHAIHLSDLSLPEGVQLSALHADPVVDEAVVCVHLPRAVVEETVATAEPPTELVGGEGQAGPAPGVPVDDE
jgi:large subunit ribosomal protein L25